MKDIIKRIDEQLINEEKIDRIFRLIVFFVLISLLLFSLATCKESDTVNDYSTVVTFRLAEEHPEDYPTTIADKEFARRVEEETEGRIRIIVYPDKELGEERSVIEQVKFGGIDFARVSIAPMSEIVSELKVLQLPYLYEDSEHMWRVLNSDIGQHFLDLVGDYGYIGLAWFDAGARSFYNSIHPITNVEDLKEMNIRVMESQLMLEMIEDLGANAIMLPYGQVYSAMQLEEVDGAENNFPSYETSLHYEIAKYYSIDEHVRVPEMLMASQKALENISSEDMAIIRKIANETVELQRQLWAEKEQESLDFLKENGVIINTIEDKSEFIQKVLPIYEEYASDYGDILSQIESLKDNDLD